MSRRKQALTSVKDLSPLPEIVPVSAKRIRRGAADRSREKVKSYVRLLQRNISEADKQKINLPAKGIAIGGRGKETGPVRKPGGGQHQRSTSPAQVVTITIRDDDGKPASATQTLSTPLPQPQMARARRSVRQYVVVDYSKLHFGSTEGPEEEEGPTQEREGWQTAPKFVPSTGSGPRRGRPLKVSPQTIKAGGSNSKLGTNGIGTFICRRCDLGHGTVEEFLNHFEAAHCPDLTDEEFRQRLYSNSHFCGRCDFRTTEKAELESHEQQHNLQPNPLVSKWRGRYHCPNCDFSATNAVTLTHHSKTHKRSTVLNGTTKATESVVFTCADCTARFSDREDVLRHQQLVHGRGSLIDL
ncbi:zinc finger protein 133-like isoform X1 [Varroa jacobsoni]|uniref:zinc finger protein 133-like isoform X1 n=1 Tax=Varroa jacobsoni TaxID=62625 RepID=UPI000BF50A76|nr:zinc finger protein 133-like isoform X1 [Varroa jacobsoni]